MSRPLLVYVSGAPGAGKTTLAAKIASELYIPHVSSDLVHGGVNLTQHGQNDRKDSLLNGFVPILIEMLKANVSIVADQVLQKDMSEDDILAKVSPYCYLVNVHVICDDPISRHLERELVRDDRGKVLDERELRERAEFHALNLQRTINPLNLDAPQMVVRTNDGYDPKFDAIINKIIEMYKKER